MSRSSSQVFAEEDSPGLLERTAELVVLEDALAAGRTGRGRLVLVEGHAGIGKTRLLDAAVDRARSSRATVLRARASELEGSFAFGVALQLFEPVLAGADPERRALLLSGSAALAEPLLEHPAEWSGDAPEERSYPVMHGLFWMLSHLTRSGPALIAVDDAHWADRPSLRLLLYLLQRLDELPVTIVAARRLGEPGAPEDLLGQLAAHRTTRRLRPTALSRDGARTMVASVLEGVDEAFGDACWRMTEGNPFLLGELVGAVDHENWDPTARNAARIGTLAPEAVLRAVAVRLMRLSDEAAGVARAVAVLGEDAHLRRVAALTGRTPETVAAAIDALAAGEILRPGGTGALTFAHPLLASAVYVDVGSAERAALHRRAAEILRAEDVAVERVAAHLLPSTGSGEDWVVEVLRAAARGAHALGAPESAAANLARALEEPPGMHARSGVLRELGAAESAIGLPGAAARLRDAVGAAQDPAERAEACFELGRALGVQGRRAEAVAALRSAVAEGGASERVVLLAGAERQALDLLDGGRRAGVLADAGVATAAEDASAQLPLLAVACMRSAMLGGDRAEVLRLADRALCDGALLAEAGPDSSAYALVAGALCACDELARAEHVLTAAVAQARATGSTMALASANCTLAMARWGQGRLPEALGCAEQALAAERQGWGHMLSTALAAVVGLYIDRGDLDAAADACSYSRGELVGDDGAASGLLALHDARGRIALAERRDADALTCFEAWRDSLGPIVNPACGAAWRSAMALALVGLGRVEEARALAEEELELARAFGAPRPVSVALRALARIRAESDVEAALVALQEAVAVASASEARLEHLRALLDYGVVLRRSGRRSDAGRALGDAQDLARSFGARLLEQRAASELEVTGARGRRAALRGVQSLSPSERRVVALAVEGRSNREIAEALFVTRKAVEWHLGNAYRKLDVRSRGELPKALGDQIL